MDLTNAPGDLTDGEKCAIVWVFGEARRAEVLPMSCEELIEYGYLISVTELGEAAEDESALYEWKNGVLFAISTAKWRSPLGA